MARSSPAPSAVRPRRRWWRALRNLVLLAALTAAVVWSIDFNRDYGTWPGLDVGSRINACGRVYREAVTDLTQAEVDDNQIVEPLFQYPPQVPRREIYGVPATAPACPGALFIRTGPDRWTKYLPA